MSTKYAESKARWIARMREEGRCLCCGGIWDGPTNLCVDCRAKKNARTNAKNAAKRARLEALGLARPRGVGGFRDHPENAYKPSPQERLARARNGSKASAQSRMSSAKWQAVKAAADAGGSWAVLADLYDLAYARGYGSGKEQRRRDAAQPQQQTTEAA